MAIYVIDEMMGRGKTSALINHINQSDPDRRYLFITPYLTETRRVMDACRDRVFFTPDEKGRKLNNIKALLARHYNIVSTHALFKLFDDEVFRILRENRYVLIMDESMATAEELSVSPYDARVMLEKYARIDEDRRIIWEDDEYVGKFNSYKEKIRKEMVYAYSDTYWVYMMDRQLFSSFDDVYIMTYMFKDQIQRCYFDYYGIGYIHKYIAGNSPETYRLSDRPEPLPPLDLKRLIHIEQDDDLNYIGDNWHALSKQWYRDCVRYDGDFYAQTIRRLLGIFFRRHGARSRDILWTCFKRDEDVAVKDPDWAEILGGDGYRRGFLSCNAKGTNKYRSRTVLAYIVNRFPNPNMYNFLHSSGIEWDRTFFALQEMLQWIWRSGIRDGKEIWVYIPSRRMRTLLENWMNGLTIAEEEKGGDGL